MQIHVTMITHKGDSVDIYLATLGTVLLRTRTPKIAEFLEKYENSEDEILHIDRLYELHPEFTPEEIREQLRQHSSSPPIPAYIYKYIFIDMGDGSLRE